jgi:MFS family permease
MYAVSVQGGVLKAAANIGNVGGQILFGFLGDSFGRRCAAPPPPALHTLRARPCVAIACARVRRGQYCLSRRTRLMRSASTLDLAGALAATLGDLSRAGRLLVSRARRFVYGKELMMVILGIIVMICAPQSLGGHGVVTWITITRVFMGIGIGGDYPLSAAVMADRAGTSRRGPLMALLFAAQGWGGLVGAICAIIVIACYKGPVDHHNAKTLDGAWRILIGLGLAPALAVLPLRLMLVESTKFKEARKLQARARWTASPSCLQAG